MIDTSTGLELIESWKSLWLRIVGVAVLLAAAAALVLIIMGSFLSGCLLAAFVLMVFYPVTAYNINTTRVHVNTRFVDIKHGPIFYRKSIAIPSGDVVDIVKTPRKKTIELQAQLRNGAKITMVSRLPDDDRADFIVRQARRHLNLVKAAPLPVLTTPKFSNGRSAQTIAGESGFRPEYA